MPAAALRALLTRSIDYAGLFPPAGLELEPALENQARYVRSAERWMLGAFVLPVAKFEAAVALLASFDREFPLEISALGPKTEEAAAFPAAVASAQRALAKFTEQAEGRARVVQLEMPLPAEDFPESLGEETFAIFWEAPAARAAATIDALRGSGAGFKLRTGGVTADAFPAAAAIAEALVSAARAQVAIKFTAGLHHPVRHFHESVGTKMHGFLNVLGAGVLAAEHGWDEAQAEAMLLDEDAAAFTFDDEHFRWHDWTIATAQIRARRRLVTSLGSCSFDEPRDDLRALGLF
ncbi:MAG: hypothetical protein ACR2MW_04215 [Chthoniobacterales bacterium]